MGEVNNKTHELLKKLIEGSRMRWTYGILWRRSDHQQVLKFHDGYFRGTGKGKEVRIMGSRVSVTEEVTDADSEWFFKISMGQTFAFHEDLPGLALKDLCPVWVNATDTKGSISRLGERHMWGTWERTKWAHQFGIQTFVCIPARAKWVLEFASTQIIPYHPQWVKRIPEYPVRIRTPRLPLKSSTFARPCRNDIRLHERANNEIQNLENDKLSTQSRGKKKISDSKCSLYEKANNEIQNLENDKLSTQSRDKKKISDSKCSLYDIANNEKQNLENDKLSTQPRGKEKISDSKCSWSLLTESSDKDTDRTFSCSHDYSGPS